ncbi:hypothetical protein BJ170DRAFT_604486 [Xylariales sp. AK1849]|nr:hypothetical protein BJ170DRAFT_604486 [Xylariales sp. AK1849]
MKPYRSSTLTGRPLIPPEQRAKGSEQEQEVKSRFELLNLKPPRFSFGSLSPSLKQPAPVYSSWLRDPTPPTTPDEALEGSEGRFSIPLGGKTPREERRICGLKRRWFWGLLAVMLVVLIGMAIGVGVGVSGSQRTSHETGGGAQSSSSGTEGVSQTSITPSATETTTVTATTTSSSSTATMTAGIDCPAGNGSTFAVPGSTVTFLHLCGVDYSGDGEAVDIKNVPTDSMADCMTNCAGTAGCTGCGWGYVDGDSLYQHTCWLKSGLKTPHTVDEGWAFAIMV